MDVGFDKSMYLFHLLAINYLANIAYSISHSEFSKF